MRIVDTAVLDDGMFLQAYVGTNRHLFVLLRDADGKALAQDWLDLGGAFTSMPNLTSNGKTVVINVLGAGGSPVPDEGIAAFWVPWITVYHHDPAKPFDKGRFTKLAINGPSWTRAAVMIPPLPPR